MSLKEKKAASEVAVKKKQKTVKNLSFQKQKGDLKQFL